MPIYLRTLRKLAKRKPRGYLSGSAAGLQTITADPLSPPQTIGAAQVDMRIAADALSPPQTIGGATLTLTIHADALSPTQTIDSHTVALASGAIDPVGLDTTQTIGSHVMTLFLEPSGLEPSPFIAYDTTANSYHGTLVNFDGTERTTSVASGAVGTALTFDGSSEHVTLPDLGFSGDVTVSISCWVYLTAGHTGNFPALVAIANPLGTGVMLLMTIKDNKPAIDFGSARWTADAAISQNAWHHLVVTKSPGAISTTSKVYVDGSEVAASVVGDLTPNVTSGGTDATIGRLTSTSEYVTGRIDEIQVFDDVLTADEVTWQHSRFRNVAGGTDPTEANLVAHYSFDDVGSIDPTTRVEPTISADALSPPQTIGAAQLDMNIVADALSPPQTIDAATLTLTIHADALSPPQTIGTHVITWDQPITATALDTTHDFGVHTVSIVGLEATVGTMTSRSPGIPCQSLSPGTPFHSRSPGV